MRSSPRVTRPLVAMLFGTLISLLWTIPATAHATVVATNPESGAVVEEAPDTITVEFSEPVTVVAAETLILAPNGTPAHDGEPTVDGSVLTYRLNENAPNGTYLVSYRVISDDGHPIPGGFTFSIGSPSAAPQLAADLDGDAFVAGALVVNRFAGYVGLALALGSVLMLVFAGIDRRRAIARLTIAGLSLVAATAVIGLYLQVPYQAGTGMFDVTGDDVGAVLASPFGGAYLVRLLIVLTALPLLRLGVTGATGRSSRLALAALAVALLGTWPFTGHALTSPVPAWSIVADVVHLGAGSLWIGGLVVLVAHLVRRDRTIEAAAFLPAWSRWATWLIIALAVAGVGHALLQAGNPLGWPETPYGRLLLVKLALFALVLASAAIARRLVARLGGASAEPGGTVDTEAVAGPDAPERRIAPTVTAVRRLIVVELVIAAAVLATTAFLVRAVPGEVGPQPQAPQYFSTELTAEAYTLQFELDPGMLGENALHLYLFTPDGEPLAPLEWDVSMSNKAAGVAPVGIGVALLAPNHVSADVVLPSAGEWLFEFKIRTGEFDRETVSATVTVE